ncbi:hypothetical protein [Cohnella cholangitidis]|uniref:Uncharacterized protein n=1 Tax=Cohnella cholangitidis TaxID=2598458 RepID=A0A7G5C631_9BACL|nr:hypothetical protein [Cohnella cholangitidis]QMV44665.1 hypothetical protein FPL14_28450 [Cohnella cholangitidis]
MSFLKTRSFAISSIVIAVLLIVYGSYEVTQISKANQFKQKMTGIRFDGIHLFMSREEVSKQHGLGLDKTEGCFGCEMNFIYANLRLSGRYSETLNTLPLVKKMTTADPSDAVFGIKVGDSFEAAGVIFVDHGFRAEGADHVYVKGLYYIQLWNDGYLQDFNKRKISERTDGIIRSITVGYRVKSDEQIQY